MAISLVNNVLWQNNNIMKVFVFQSHQQIITLKDLDKPLIIVW